MAKYSLAICAAAVIIYENAHGDRSGNYWRINSGDLDDQGSAYEIYEIINHIPRERVARHPLNCNAAVRDSIGNTKDGKEMFTLSGYINYPGISNAPSRVFELNERWRISADDLRKRKETEGLDAREEKLLDCLDVTYEKFSKSS